MCKKDFMLFLYNIIESFFIYMDIWKAFRNHPGFKNPGAASLCLCGLFTFSVFVCKRWVIYPVTRHAKV